MGDEIPTSYLAIVAVVVVIAAVFVGAFGVVISAVGGGEPQVHNVTVGDSQTVADVSSDGNCATLGRPYRLQVNATADAYGYGVRRYVLVHNDTVKDETRLRVTGEPATKICSPAGESTVFSLSPHGVVMERTTIDVNVEVP